jgi:outer membrane immunogenic protein
MRSVLVSAIVLTGLGLARPGLAADLPLRGSVLPPVAPMYSWSGYYVGGNIGYSWGKEDLNVSGFTVNGIPVPGVIRRH